MPRNVRLMLLLAALFVGVGCEMEYRVVRNGWDDLPIDAKPTGPEQAADAAGGQGWAIRLTQFRGPDRYARAKHLVEQLRSESAMGHLWIEDLDGMVTIYRGRYADADSAEARRDLALVRDLQVEGLDAVAFDEAVLVPLVGGGRRIADPLNLKQYAGFYSLQVAFYDEAFTGDRYGAAEEAARILREDGHDAYYYHGPHRSLVTVGLFTYAEAFVTRSSPFANRSTVDAYAPQIVELQKTFPYNLGNGRTLIEKQDGKTLGEQESCLVRVF